MAEAGGLLGLGGNLDGRRLGVGCLVMFFHDLGLGGVGSGGLGRGGGHGEAGGQGEDSGQSQGISLFIFQFLVRFDDMERFSMTSS